MKFFQLATATSVLCFSLFQSFAFCSELTEDGTNRNTPTMDESEVALQTKQLLLESAGRNYLRQSQFNFKNLPDKYQNSVGRFVAKWKGDVSSMNSDEMTLNTELGSPQFLAHLGKDLTTSLLVFVAASYELINSAYIEKNPCNQLVIFFLASFIQFYLLMIRTGAEAVARVIRDVFKVELSKAELDIASYFFFFVFVAISKMCRQL